MGLGKTLTTIALIVLSQEHAKSFADEQETGPMNIGAMPRTRATLVIVPNTSTDLACPTRDNCILLTVIVILDSWTGEVER